ncbi:hypothetical protein F5Y12DRAFT_717691 [Xylaria sp. FL1777]|nr:hypothetical protein F5Y12DRAFT_717691 [Xylaria sp. FL1777]
MRHRAPCLHHMNPTPLACKHAPCLFSFGFLLDLALALKKLIILSIDKKNRIWAPFPKSPTSGELNSINRRIQKHISGVLGMARIRVAKRLTFYALTSVIRSSRVAQVVLSRTLTDEGGTRLTKSTHGVMILNQQFFE